MSYFTRLLALRYSFSRKQSPLLAFISRLSIASIVLAVALLLTVLSVMNGFERALKDDILSLVPHITLTRTEAISDWQPLQAVAAEQPGVASVAAFSLLPSMFVKGQTIKPSLVYGIDLDNAQQLASYQRFLPNFDWQQLNQPGSVIVARGLADKLGLNIGDSFRLIDGGSAVKSRRAGPARLRSHTVQVLAIIHTGTELDQKLAFASLENTAKFKGFAAGEVDGLRIQVEDIFNSRAIAYDISALTELYYFRDWSMSQGNLYQAVQMSKKLVVLLTFIIIAVAAFNVVSSLLLSVQEKKPDMAILQTMGASQRQIRQVFLLQGIVIGCIGVLLGVLLGVVLSSLLPSIAGVIEQLLGIQLLNSEIYPIDALPSEIRITDVLAVGAISFMLTLAATLSPAWIAARQKPAEVLRYE
ncbi:MAG: lipoprotein-releasing ABC transporter permease subunit [Pseudomonadales bacterium]|nr:lipoprotein-releasing ABC transporter permease subunit [Pseudomonadales bacterium]